MATSEIRVPIPASINCGYLSAQVVDWTMGAAPNSSKIGISSFAGLSRTQLIFALAGTMLTLLTSAMDQSISTIAMPHAIASLNGFARYSWPATSFSLTSAIAIPVFAKLSDLYGRKCSYAEQRAPCQFRSMA